MQDNIIHKVIFIQQKIETSTKSLKFKFISL